MCFQFSIPGLDLPTSHPPLRPPIASPLSLGFCLSIPYLRSIRSWRDVLLFKFIYRFTSLWRRGNLTYICFSYFMHVFVGLSSLSGNYLERRKFCIFYLIFLLLRLRAISTVLYFNVHFAFYMFFSIFPLYSRLFSWNIQKGKTKKANDQTDELW